MTKEQKGKIERIIMKLYNLSVSRKFTPYITIPLIILLVCPNFQAGEPTSERTEKLQNIIRILRIETRRPNYAGGVDANVIFTNTSNKTIKYVRFTLEPYNAVGDRVFCTVRRRSSATGRVTGPVEPKETNGGYTVWRNMWYNNTIREMKINKIEIDYMDGSQEIISSDEVPHILALDEPYIDPATRVLWGSLLLIAVLGVASMIINRLGEDE